MQEGRVQKPRIAVVSAYSFGYDVLQSPQLVEADLTAASYTVYTNLPTVDISPWETRSLPQISSSTKRNILFVKTHLLDLLPDFDAYIWHDARLCLKVSPAAVVGSLSTEATIGTFRHPRHETLLGEISEIGAEQLVPLDDLERFKRSLPPADLHRLGHSETNLLVFRRGEEATRFFKKWWRAIEDSPARCQLTFDKVAYETGTRIMHLEGGRDASTSELVSKGRHRQPRTRILVSSRVYEPTPIVHSPDRAAALSESSHQTDLEVVETKRLSTAVVVPISGEPGMEGDVLLSVLKSDFSGPIHCVLNGATSDTEERLERLAEEHAGLTLHKYEKPLGFSGACNAIGLSVDEDLILFLNSDALVPSQWHATLTRIFTDSKVATAGPIGFNTGDHSLGYIDSLEPERIDHDSWKRLEGFSQAWQAINGNIELRHVHGSAIVVRSSLFSALGGFSAESFPQGYGEEIDLCLRLFFDGFKNVAVPTFSVIHKGSATFGARRQRLVQAGRQVLRDLYGDRLIESLSRDTRANSRLQQYQSDVHEWSRLYHRGGLESLILGATRRGTQRAAIRQL